MSQLWQCGTHGPIDAGCGAGPVGLRPPAHRVARAAMVHWAVRAVPGWLVLLGIEAMWLLGAAGPTQWRAWLLLATAAAALLHLIVMPQWRYRVHRWETTPQAVYTQSGWFNQERRIAPISRIQTVDSQRGPMEQLFGLANVTVTTASAAGPLHIHGLPARPRPRWSPRSPRPPRSPLETPRDVG